MFFATSFILGNASIIANMSNGDRIDAYSADPWRHLINFDIVRSIYGVSFKQPTNLHRHVALEHHTLNSNNIPFIDFFFSESEGLNLRGDLSEQIY